jgi:hypothetical protein
MKKISFLIVFFLLIPFAIAEDEWLYSDSAIIKINFSSSLDARVTSNNYIFEGLKINLSMLPKNTSRQTVSINYFPDLKTKNDDAIFETYSLGKFDFGYHAEIKTTNSIKKVTKKINFPLQSKIPKEIEIYTKPGERIDSDNEDIIRTASKLAEGEDDYFVVVDKISDFVNKDVTYDLSTLFIKGTKSASWVLENKEGVCSEISVLFIAMLRSVGIPARFVSGISYTNSELFDYKFGPHAWAEVYFPDIGWIPYDITYGEFGYIDLGHIEMKKSADASETSTSYSWKAKNVVVDASETKINGELIEKNNQVTPEIIIDAKPYYERVSFLSYNVIIADIENPNNYYVSRKIKIANTENLELIETEKQIVLRPKEKKRMFFAVKAPNLEKNYYYTFPVTIYTEQNERSDTKFFVGRSWFSLDENGLFEITSQIPEDDEKIYSKKIGFSCFKREYYIDEEISLKCSMENKGNIYFEDVDVCVDDGCEKINLGIAQEKKLNFTIKPKNSGTMNLPVRISRESINLDEESNIELTILDVPEINIESIEYPNNVSFDDEFEISFVLNKTSESLPRNVVAKIIIDGDARKLNVNDFENKYKVKALFSGKELRKKSNVELKVEYEDSIGRKYLSQKNIEISLRELTFIQKARIFFNDAKAFLLRII